MPTQASLLFRGGGVLVPVYPEPRPVRQRVNLPASISYRRGQLLGEVVGTNEVQTITITGSPTSGTFTITHSGNTTDAIAYNATAATVQAALLALPHLSPNGRQTVTLGGGVSGGTFQLTLEGFRSTPIAYNATATEVQAALATIPMIGSTSNVTVSGSAGGPFTITFGGSLAGVYMPALGVIKETLSPVAATVTVAVVSTGGNQQVVCSGGPLPATAVNVTFQGSSGFANIAAMTTTDSLSGGSVPASAVTTPTAGVAGTAGLWRAYDAAGTDGRQVPKGLLEVDVTTDASGNVFLGSAATSEFGQSSKTAPVFLRGPFDTRDLVGLSEQAITAAGWRIISGTVANGVLLLP